MALAVGAERPVTRHLMATSASPPRPCSTSVSASHDRVRARTNEPLALHGVPTAAATPIHGSLRRPGPGSKHLDRVVRVSEWAVEPRRRRPMPPTAGRAGSWSCSLLIAPLVGSPPTTCIDVAQFVIVLCSMTVSVLVLLWFCGSA